MQSGKQLLLATLRHEPVTQIPWVPFAGVHAGRLKGYDAEMVLRDGDKLFEALIEVNRLYDPDGQPVIFDLQIEAEILGCELLWAEKAPPSVASHPLESRLEVPTYLPEAGDGRLPMVLDVMRRMKAAVGDKTALYGLVSGPLTLASHLRGTEIFMDMLMNPQGLKALLSYTRDVCLRMIDLYWDAGMDVIALVDPLVSQIGPKHFAQFLHEPFTTLFSHIRQHGAFSSLFVCGDATKNIEAMCATQPDSISVDENIDFAKAKTITDQHNIVLGGNIPLTTVMLLGSQQDNMNWVVDWLDKVSPGSAILAPGCDMPYDVPIENCIGIIEAIRHPEHARKMLEHYAAPDLASIPVELPDYAHLPRPLVEVFTLDSDSCPACGYMFVAATRAVREIGTPIDIVEHKFTRRENVARCMKMGVKNLPSIYINGELKYSSIIPSNEELLETLRGVVLPVP
jgi:uroporphyrinogen decarboxylase